MRERMKLSSTKVYQMNDYATLSSIKGADQSGEVVIPKIGKIESRPKKKKEKEPSKNYVKPKTWALSPIFGELPEFSGTTLAQLL